MGTICDTRLTSASDLFLNSCATSTVALLLGQKNVDQ